MDPMFAALEMVRMGVIRVEPNGTIWRDKEIRNTGAVVPVESRRAESQSAGGYLKVKIRYLGRQFNVYAHRLVQTVLIGPIPPETDVNHIDGIKANNHPFNLELATRSENHRHAYRTGLRRIGWALSDDKKAEIAALRRSGLSFSQIAKAAQVSQTAAFRYSQPTTS